MSEPLIKSELHEQVEDYVHDHLGEDSIAHYLHEEIDHPEKRSWIYEQYLDFLNN